MLCLTQFDVPPYYPEASPPVRGYAVNLVGTGSSDSQLPGLVTRNYNPHRKLRRFRLSHSARFVTSRLHFYRARQNVSTVWKCLSLGDFVLRKTPVPINDPVCILKSPEAAFWKA